VRAAIELLATLPGRRWLVLGDMAELGAFAPDEHARLGELARSAGIERLYVTGPLAAHAAAAFGAGATTCADVPALIATLRAAVVEAGTEARVLVKGSRFNRLERVIEALAGDAAPGGGAH
jgi:UDP-N-acetylmuramoyl-tripeptide--D-alanyl-D-alanine ligase